MRIMLPILFFLFLPGVLGIGPSSLQFQGCITDTGTSHALGGASTTTELTEVTLDGCIEWCRETKKYPFAGMKNGNECFCGYQIATSISNSLSCYDNNAIQCPGDSDVLCGAQEAISIYRVCPLGYTLEDCLLPCTSGCGNKGCPANNGGCLGSCQAGYRMVDDTCTACDSGTFGPRCSFDCTSLCAYDACDPRDGRCLQGCKQTSRKGPYCTESCPNGIWGSACNTECNAACDSTCDRDSGRCDACKSPSAYGPKCDENCGENCGDNKCDRATGCTECKAGYWGETCSRQCDSNCQSGCDRDSGRCNGCKDQRYGDNCQNSCPANCLCTQTTKCISCKSGYYGQECRSRCSGGCQGGTCNKADGKCYPCKPNWKGDNCDICSDGKYGVNCDLDCGPGCLYDFCDKANGHCQCKNGWTGAKCDVWCGYQCKVCTQDFGCTECKDRYYGSTCQSSCSYGCYSGTCKKDTGECKLGCKTGKYGSMCNAACPGNCLGVCHRSDGDCYQCKQGYYDNKCQSKCAANCLSGCIKATGKCNGCKTGYFGDRCDTACGDHCTSCSQSGCSACQDGYHGVTCAATCGDGCQGRRCDKNEGDCSCVSGYYKAGCTDVCPGNCKGGCWKSYGYCNECKEGFHGNRCTSRCPVNCDGACRQNNGNCHQCKGGHHGNNCGTPCELNCLDGCFQNNGTCHRCIDRKYGEKCQDDCSTSCSGPCEQFTGQCACNVGYYGLQCDSRCSPNCNETDCGKFNGHCSYGCMDGFHGDLCRYNCSSNCAQRICDRNTEKCTKGCVDGFHGSHCNETCSLTCEGNTCEQTTATCSTGCLNGFYGDTCQKNCSANCMDSTCKQATGRCTKGCLTGFFGDACHKNCTGNCLNSVCNQNEEATVCSAGCEVGFYGGSCNQTCPNVCLNQQCVRYSDGNCEAGCVPGRQGEKCDAVCNKHSFGAECSGVCHCVNGDESCDPVNGTCSNGCAEGWEGENCQLKAKAIGPRSSAYVTPVAAVLVIIVIAVIVIILVIFVLRRRKSNHLAKGRNINIAADNHIDEEISLDECSTKDDADAAIAAPVYSNVPVNNNNEKNKKDYSSVPLSIDKIENHIKNAEKTGNLVKEFQSLTKQPMAPWDVALQQPEKKNRFKNIMAYDHNRVLLQDIEGQDSDYINASYIPGYNNEREYVASQGPTPHSMIDFIRMIWEQKVTHIVMLTSLEEGGKAKCTQYWPAAVNRTMVYKTVKVTLLEEIVKKDVTMRKMKFMKGGVSLVVMQYHYISWPDHGVPPSAAALLNIRRRLSGERTDTFVLVHCSAGVGRTGSYIAVDILLQQAEIQGTVNVPECVKKLRQNRVSMVQTQVQYNFVYKAVLEGLTLGQTTFRLSEFMEFQQEPDHEDDLLKQYNMLSKLKHQVNDNELQLARKKANKDKNRSSKILPASLHRVMLMTVVEGRSDYINAVTVDGVHIGHQYYVTQFPLADTVVDFWRMVVDYNLSTVVQLTKSSKKRVATPWLPKTGCPLTLPCFSVHLSSTSFDGNKEITVKETTEAPVDDAVDDAVYENMAVEKEPEESEYMNVQETQKNAARGKVLHQLTVVSLSVDTPDRVVDGYNRLSEIMQRQKPMAVMCLNGASESGVFIAAHRLLDTADAHDEVDMYDTVLQIRATRPQFIENVGQYKFLRDIISEYTSRKQQFVKDLC